MVVKSKAILGNLDKSYVDINARVFHNKSNGQISITLPKKQLKKVLDYENKESVYKTSMPKKIPIRIFRWSN